MSTATQDLKTRFGQRLERARLMRGLSLRGLSDALGGLVSYNAIAKYEKGLMGPDSSVLIALCRALGVDTEFFFRPTTITLSKIGFRKRTSVTGKEVDRIREEARDFFERYLEIESILGLKQHPLPQVDLTTEKDFERLLLAAEHAAGTVRKAWKLGINPIQNVHEELEHGGVKVKEVESEANFDGFSGWAENIPVIVLAKHLNDNLPRKRFTAAHEHGHLVLQLPDGLTKKEEERICDRFAGSFLMPAAALSEFGAKRSQVTLGELKALKGEWGLSLQAIMRRFENLEIITPARRKGFDFVYRAKYKWHVTGEPGEWIGSETASRFPLLVHRAAAEEMITRAKAAALLGVPARDLDRSMAVLG
jgi:Zn-dependent peptidase ImmA (M78 family)/transcriptional regulator with XRE-family HTH domain